MRQLLSFIAFFILTLTVGFAVSQFPTGHIFFGIFALLIFFFSFVNVEFGLYLLIFSMLLSPEFVVGATEGASLGRGVTLRFDDFLLIIIGAGWFARNAIYKELGLFPKTPLNKPLLLYVMVCALATGWGIMGGRVVPKTGLFFVLKYCEYFVVFFITVNHIQDKDRLRRLVFCLLLTCFIVSVIGFLQIPGGGRVSAPFEGETGEPNTFGGYLVFMLAIAAGLFIKSDKVHSKEMLVALMAIMIPPLLFTQSRASYLAAMAVLLIIGLFSRKRGLVLAVLLLGLILSPILLPSVVKERILYTFTQPVKIDQQQVFIGAFHLDTSTTARIEGWRQAVVDWTRHPLLGYGVTGYRFIDAQFPRVLAETGALGMIAFILLLYSVFRMAFYSLRNVGNPFYKGLCVGYMAGTVGLLVHSLGANTFIIVRIMEPFWFFTGIIFVLPGLDNTLTESPGSDVADLYVLSAPPGHGPEPNLKITMTCRFVS